MGAWFSKRDQFKSPAQLQEELEQIDVQMAALEAREAALERQRRRLVLLVLSIAVLVVLVLVVRWYWFYYPPLVDSWTSYSLLAKPNFVVVVLVFGLRKVINSIYRFFIGRVRRRRDELKETGKRELVEHLKAIDFAKTQRLLVQYKARFSDKPEQPSTPVQRKPPQPQAPKTAPPKPSAPPLAESVAPVQPLRTPQAAIRPVHQPQPAPEPPRSPYMPPVPRPASTGPIVQRASVQQQQQQQQQQPGSAPPASFLDRTVAWLVGEGAEQESSAPLLCRRCQAPQRLIPQGEIVEFVCAKCGFLNRDRDEPAEQAEQRANDDVDDSASDATWAASSDDADPDDDNDAAKPVASDEEDQITKED